ncbi:hypothetical protein J6590_040574 [Homalodisca vitripennis]|nr:hypothetical protein J6590_040574 [Homalodisca vitripennis]
MIEKENLIDLQGDTELERKFKESSLTSFWIAPPRRRQVHPEPAPPHLMTRLARNEGILPPTASL